MEKGNNQDDELRARVYDIFAPRTINTTNQTKRENHESN